MFETVLPETVFGPFPKILLKIFSETTTGRVSAEGGEDFEELQPLSSSLSLSYQALPRRRLVRRMLVSGDGAHVSAIFSRPERGRTEKSLTEVHLVLVFPVF